MARDETFIDAPVTPAPLFAYRALRGMIFGSPETPAIVQNHSLGNGHNKENELHISPKKTQTLKTNTRLTPTQKRRREGIANTIISPTKSCLRTPGAVTPRRELLRDVNVTFMDASSRGISPELRRSSPERTKRSYGLEDKQAKNALDQPRPQGNVTTKNSLAKPVHHITLLMESPPQNLDMPDQPTSRDQIVIAPDFNIETYMTTTEKEMKKLIKYSQKMREYARKQDEENTKLKQLVDELKNENARLKRKFDKLEPEAPGLENKESIKRTPSISEPEQKRRKVHETTVPQSSLLHSKPASSTRPVLGTLHSNRLNSLNNTRATSNINPVQEASTNQSDQQDNQLFNLKREHPRDQVHKSTIQTTRTIPLRISPTTATATAATAATAAAVGTSTTSNAAHATTTTTTTNANLAPDRLAAARARIRQRTETRRTSTQPPIPSIPSIPYDHQGQTPLQTGTKPPIFARHTIVRDNSTARSEVQTMDQTKSNHNVIKIRKNDNDTDKDRNRDKDRDSSMLDWAGL